MKINSSERFLRLRTGSWWRPSIRAGQALQELATRRDQLLEMRVTEQQRLPRHQGWTLFGTQQALHVRAECDPLQFGAQAVV